jgi:hypothetical protein
VVPGSQNHVSSNKSTSRASRTTCQGKEGWKLDDFCKGGMAPMFCKQLWKATKCTVYGTQVLSFTC